MAIVTTDNQHYTDIAAAIRSKNGTKTQYKPSEMAAAISAISGGKPVIEPLEITSNGTYIASEGVDGYSPVTVNVNSGETPVPTSPKEVNFYDYDGTLLYAYTLEEAKSLSNLPSAPQHEGLLFQEWNWSLEDIKSLTTYMNVGATYITDDGKTRLYISIPSNINQQAFSFKCEISLSFIQNQQNGVIINWGDGTKEESSPEIDKVDITHVYGQPGEYVITLDPIENTILILGHNSSVKNIMGNISNSFSCYALKKVFLGCQISNSQGLSDYAFSGCYNLKSITIPNNVGNFSAQMFSNCAVLKSIVIPSDFYSISKYSFSSCYSLQTVCIPKKIYTINDGGFRYCYNLTNILFSREIQAGSSTFQSCYGLSEINVPVYFEQSSYELNETFYNCRGITKILISEKNSYISKECFYYCCSLQQIIIPKTIKSISSNSFEKCFGMKEYHFLSETPPTLNQTNAFSGISSDCIIYVPKGSAEAYKTATNWTTYAQYIQEEPA